MLITMDLKKRLMYTARIKTASNSKGQLLKDSLDSV